MVLVLKKKNDMKVYLLIILAFSQFILFNCDRNITVSVNDIQVDTLKFHKITKHKTVKGKLLSWRDTTKALMSGQVKYYISEEKGVKAGDTVLYIQSENRISEHRQKWVDHSAIQSLKEKTRLLKNTLKRMNQLKEEYSKNKNLSESDVEQLIVSLENTGVNYNDLNKDVDFELISKGIRSKIKKLQKEITFLDQKMKSNQSNSGYMYVVSKCDGDIKFKVENNERVNPGDPLFYVQSQIHDPVVIKLDQIPNKELQFDVKLKIDNDIVTLNLDSFEENKRIVRITGDVLKKIQSLDSNVRISFESEPDEKLLVNRSAVFHRGGDYYVFVKRNEFFKSVKVEVGESQGSMIEILKGLQPNDQIIVSSSKPIWHISHLEIKE